jgi:putative phage-type endonuclease
MNPYRSSIDCFYEKTGLREVILTKKMQEGSDMEPFAREAFIKETGFNVKPGVFISNTYPWLMCSMDGLSDNGLVGVEIKCGASACKSALRGNIPAYYNCQMQHQMLVLELEDMYYWTFDGETGKLLRVHRDEALIKRIINETKPFHEDLLLLKPPQPDYSDFDMPLSEWLILAEANYKKIMNDLQEAI